MHYKPKSTAGLQRLAACRIRCEFMLIQAFHCLLRPSANFVK
jgi:hypothetical protein